MMKDLLLGDLAEKNASIYGNKTAFIYANTKERNTDAKLSFLVFEQRSKRVAQALLKMGVKEGDRVAIIDYNTIPRVEVEFGVFKVGAILVPLNWRYLSDEYLYVLNDSEPVSLFVRDEFVEKIDSIRNKLTFVKNFISIGGKKEHWKSYEKLIESGTGEKISRPRITGNNLAMLIYTAGSTGHPKGVMLTHRNILAVCAEGHATAQLRFGDITLTNGPLFHSGGHAVFIQNFYLGNTFILVQRFDAEFVLEVVCTEKVTHMQGIVTVWQKLMEVAELTNYNLSSLRTVGYGGSPMNETLLKRMLMILPENIRFGSVLGATETSGYAIAALSYRDYVMEGSSDHLETKKKRMVSVGLPCPNILIRIGNDKGHEVPLGGEGEILLRGPNITKGYWRKPEATEDAFVNGWFRLQDMGKMDEGGYIYLLDRKHNMIISGGENIYPAEVESVLLEHPGVLEAAVIGVPDEKWGETVKAIVVLREERTTSENELIEFCKQHLASFKKPTSVDFVEALPKTGPGKIDKKRLKKPFWKSHEKQIN